MISLDTKLRIVQKCRNKEPLSLLEEELLIKDVIKHVRNSNTSDKQQCAIDYVKSEYGDTVVVKYRSLFINIQL